jgi:ribosome maturation factor RimP
MNEITQKIRSLIEPYLNEKGYEIYELEYKKEGTNWILRLFTDNTTKTISLDDCADVSRMVSDVLDKDESLIPVAYNLEVSSPGLDRLLRNEADYMWALNKTLKVKYTNDDNKKNVVEGKLQKIQNNVIEIEINKKEIINIDINKIESARRVMKFDEIAPKK